MFKKLIFSLVCLGSCYLLHTVLLSPPRDVSLYLQEFIFDPLYFLRIMIVFFIGFLAGSRLIKDGIELARDLFWKKEVPIEELAASCLFLLIMASFCLFGFAPAIFLLGFSLFYGIISVDWTKSKQKERERQGIE